VILNSITLQDYALYAGTVELRLAPSRRSKQKHPIVLIGGRNGAGKTSLLEAVRLVLYGKLSLGARVSQSEYDEFLRSKVHRPKAGGRTINAASVTLEFDYAENGEINRYEAKRSWVTRGQSVTETLDIAKNGSTIANVPREEWNHFLQELLPPGVSQLFFFDGEKIKEIAEDSDNDEQLATAIRSLLGIEIIDRLRTDLGLFITRHERNTGDASNTRLDEVVRELARIDREIGEQNDVLADLETAKESHARTAEAAKRRFVAQGGDIALNRGRLEAELLSIKHRVELLQGKLREWSGGLLPFLVAPRLLARVIEVTASPDSKKILNEESGNALLSSLEVLKNAPATKLSAKWTEAHWQDVSKIISEISSQKSNDSLTNPIFSQPELIHSRLSTAKALHFDSAVELALEHSELIVRQQEIQTALSRVDDTTTEYLLTELQNAEQKLGAADARLNAKLNEHKEKTYQRALLERERGRILNDQADSTKGAYSAAMAGKVAGLLRHYEEKLVVQKISQLEESFVHCFNQLARKTDLVRGVKIDSTSFRVTLIDDEGAHIEKKSLSAGEKQIYAIAMLWALAKTSGRTLPMIIDTPLGRLDSKHRAAIVERYLPEASHQVIVLSTDTEIDSKMATSLEQHVSHSYLLEYLPKERRTTVAHGYFNGTRFERSTRALHQA
jgi:DNA sulfur modification protein DndD